MATNKLPWKFEIHGEIEQKNTEYNRRRLLGRLSSVIRAACVEADQKELGRLGGSRFVGETANGN